MDINFIARTINTYGFPIIETMGIAYILYYVWIWTTTEVKPVIGDTNTVLIALIDRIRMLDQDILRLNQKVNTVLYLRGKIIESERVIDQYKIERKTSNRFNRIITMKDTKLKNDKKED